MTPPPPQGSRRVYLNGNLKWIVGIVATLAAMYFTNIRQGDAVDSGLGNRVTALETQGRSTAEALARIEERQKVQDQRFYEIVRDWNRGVDRFTGEPLPLQRGQQP